MFGHEIPQITTLRSGGGSPYGCVSRCVELSVLGVYSLHVAPHEVQRLRKEGSERSCSDVDYGGYSSRYVHHRGGVDCGYTQGLQRRVDEA